MNLVLAFLVLAGPLSAGAGPVTRVEISFVHHPPASLVAGRPAAVEGYMLGASEVDRAELFLRLGAAAEWHVVELELVAGDHYRADIPATMLALPGVGGARAGTDLELQYYVVATDFLGESHAALASAAEPVRVRLTPAPAPVLAPGSAPVSMSAPSSARPLYPPLSLGWEAAGLNVTGPSAQTEVTAERIRSMGARDLNDILRSVPEVEVRRSPDGGLCVSVRGSETERDTILVLDGHRLDNRYDGQLLLTLPAHLIERVLVRRGPAIGVEQVGGLAGVIEIFTRRRPGVDLTIRGGSHLSHLTADSALRYGTYRLDALGGYDLGPVALRGHFGFDLSDGAQRLVRRDAFGGADNAATLSDVPGPARDDRIGLAGGASATIREILPGELSFLAHYFFEQRGGYVGLVDTYGPDSAANTHMLAVQARYQVPLGDMGRLTARAGFDLQRGSRRYQLTPTGFTLSDRDGDGEPETFSVGVLEEQSIEAAGGVAEVAATFGLPLEQHVTVGLVAAYHDLGEPLVRRNIDPLGAVTDLRQVANPPLLVPDRGRFQLAGYLSDAWAIHESLHLTMGLRFVWLSDLGRVEADKALGPRLALAFVPVPPLTLRLHYASTFRPPTIAELTDRSVETLPEPLQSGRYVGNPRLVAANQHAVEVSATYSAEQGGWRYEATIGFYYAHLFDGIVAMPESGNADSFAQRPDRNQLGLNAQGRLRIGERATFFAAGWWHRITEQDSDANLSPLTQVPQIGALFGLWLNVLDVLELSLVARYGSERRNNGRTVLERTRSYRIPATLVADATVRSVVLFGLVRVGITAHNLFDLDLRDPVSRPDLMPDLVPREGLMLLGTIDLAYELEEEE